MERSELKGKIKTLTQGSVSDAVVDKMALTFQGLSKLADFDAPRPGRTGGAVEPTGGRSRRGVQRLRRRGYDWHRRWEHPAGLRLGGFVYNVELHFPESRDPAVYEALFRALKAHLLG